MWAEVKFETKIVAPNVLLEVKDMAADPISGVWLPGLKMSVLFTEDYWKSFVVDTIFCMHFLDTECMVNTPDQVLNAGVGPIKFCSLTNWCAVMLFVMLKIVGGVSSKFGAVTFCTAADDFLLSCFVFAPL